MESIKKFFANKTVAYYIAICDAVLALVLGIIYVATMKTAIGNNAAGNVPESVGIYLLAGAAVQAVLCVLPQYRFVGIFAIVLFGLSLYKEVFLVPDFIAGLANGIEYNGGNAALNIFYLVGQLVIIISAVVVSFMKFYKNDEEADADFKAVKGTTNIAKVSGGAVVVIAAMLISTLSVGAMKKNAAGSGNSNTPSSGEKEEEEKPSKPVWNPVTDEIKALAAGKQPATDPTGYVFAKEETYDFNDETLAGVTAGAATRENRQLIYLFEGAYSEGYQGQYNEYYTNLYLWDDGIMTGKSNSQTFKGYWYNDMDGDGTVDCLNMVSGSAKYASIVCSKETGFYNYQAYVFMHPGWGDGRSIIVAGYMYYDAIALAINTTKTGLNFTVGDSFKTSDWTLNRILANLSYGAVFNTPDGSSTTQTKWTIPSGLIVDGKLALAGEFEIKASWGGLETSVKITVAEASAE
ncbi:MAG: hypothetical protein MJZ37_01640 [Bacilli bacterium]|nr:hypothetical protein [Bacilli bacterium]